MALGCKLWQAELQEEWERLQKERQAEKAKLRAELERETKEDQAAEKARGGKDAEKQASRDLPQLLQLTGCCASRQYQSARQGSRTDWSAVSLHFGCVALLHGRIESRIRKGFAAGSDWSLTSHMIAAFACYSELSWWALCTGKWSAPRRTRVGSEATRQGEG